MSLITHILLVIIVLDLLYVIWLALYTVDLWIEKILEIMSDRQEVLEIEDLRLHQVFIGNLKGQINLSAFRELFSWAQIFLESDRPQN